MAIVSLGSGVVFDFFHNPSRVYQLLIGETDFGITPSRSYYLRPGSVLYFTGEHYSGNILFNFSFLLTFWVLMRIYSDYLHGIRPGNQDTITSSLANVGELDIEQGSCIERGQRISCLFWT